MASENKKTVEEQLQQMQKQLGELANANKQLQQTNAQLSEKVESLSKAAPAEEKAAPRKPLRKPEDVFTSHGKKWRFRVPKFMRDGKEVLATDALAEKDVLDSIVADHLKRQNKDGEQTPGIIEEVA